MAMEIKPATTPLSLGATRPAMAKDALSSKPDKHEAAMHAAAEKFETTFVAEMLKYTGLNKTPDGFGGGEGEEAFSSFLTQEYARLVEKRGGLGIAEQVFNALKKGAETQ